MKVYNGLFKRITSVENLFLAWEEFRRGKAGKVDIMRFEQRLEENIFDLHRQLVAARYKHGSYHGFYITDPKQRLIHKALVRDRVLHHAIFKVLNPILEPTFIANSFSCRIGKGTHKGVRTLSGILRKASQNHTMPCYALKCDIHKFFASIDHQILINILTKKLKDEQVLRLLKEIIGSFNTVDQLGKGLPIGNLTSQLFANVYLNEFDQFVKHQLRVRHYVRYTDDFVIVSSSKKDLEELLPKLGIFLYDGLKLKLHPDKIIIRKYIAGVDFLGYVIFPHHIVLRTKTKKRILRKVNKKNLPSYLGMCSHANTYELQKSITAKAGL